MDKEKQIEEMARDIRFAKELVIDHDVSCEYQMARILTNKGYRKQREGEWISADNPPKTYRDEYGELIPFLVCCRGTVHPFRAMYDGKNWGDGIGRLNVTHWMPLPEPPKMKGGE